MGKGKLVAKIIERARAGYEVEEAEYGKVYKWQPETVVVECVRRGDGPHPLRDRL